jgi:uncharacterized protein
MHVVKRRLAKYTRWLHIYLSMTSFLVVFFFAVTGWTLNHPDLFGGQERRTRVTGTLDAALVKPGADVQRDAVVAAIREAHHVGGALADVRIDDNELAIAFKGPGYAADVVVDRRSGSYELSESRLGIVAVVNDLHKGRDTGGTWRALIDVAAWLLAALSLTGLVLIYFIHKHRLAGVATLLAGGAVTMLLYWMWVP